MNGICPALQTERTSEGIQILFPGVAPITARERVAARIAAPLCARRAQRVIDFGLFDADARDQLSLF